MPFSAESRATADKTSDNHCAKIDGTGFDLIEITQDTKMELTDHLNSVQWE